jgi:hypothetical protein
MCLGLNLEVVHIELHLVVAMLEHFKTGWTGYISGFMDESVLAKGEVTVSNDIPNLERQTYIT